MNYFEDRFGKECLKLSANCKADMKFGAVLVRNGKIVGRGWNKRSTAEERSRVSHTDYAIHAEQLCILDALKKKKGVSGGKVYVLGISKFGNLSVREGKQFTCYKCPHIMKKYGITVMIPTVSGWTELTADEALQSSKEHKYFWTNFVKNKPKTEELL